jgi:fructosamine-3-kinase
MQALEKEIESAVTRASGTAFRIAEKEALGGGCIHNANCIVGEDQRRFFIKQNGHSFLASFEAEAISLKAIAATDTIKVPMPIAVCAAGNTCALVLEYLPMGKSQEQDWNKMGEQLARLHQCTHERFGWDQDNWIGSTPQVNSWKGEWVTFYAECRLQPQIRWARKKGLRLGQAEALIDKFPAFFENYTPVASLLHGDLWAGNASFLNDGSPVIFDPASYYGDRETDLALTELFGGFPGKFYDGYESVWPIDPGYRLRKDLYQLYHILNHYIIFGGGYGAQAEGLIGRLIAAV